MKLGVILLWPLGLALIAAVAALLAGRPPAGRSIFRRASDRLPTVGDPHGAATADAAKLIAIAIAGATLTFVVMLALGAAWVVHHGSSIDGPIYRFTIHHQTHHWTHAMNRLTRIGDTWTTWGAAGAAAGCLAAAWQRWKWVPPTALATVIVVDHYVTLAIRHVFERVGPPNSPHGTYPSGGCERVILFYGLIAYLAWRETSGRRTSGIWAGAGIAMLAFNEAYSRSYLTLHWFTDAVSGLLYGVLMLIAFVIAVRMVVGPVVPRGGERAAAQRPAPGTPTPAATG